MAPSSASVGDPSATPHGEISTLQRASGYTIWPLVSNSDSSGNTKASTGDMDTEHHPHQVVDGVGIVELYASLRQGQSVKQWYMKHSDQLANIDIRRFITFGIIKGFLYRVHKYAYETGQPVPTPIEPRAVGGALPSHSNLTPRPSDASSKNRGYNSTVPYSSSGGNGDLSEQSASFRSAYAHESGHGYAHSYDDDDEESVDDKTLSKYLDGIHCFDQICTELELSERELTARLKKYPYEVLIIHR